MAALRTTLSMSADEKMRNEMSIVHKYETLLGKLARHLGLPRQCLGMYTIESQIPTAHYKCPIGTLPAVTVAVAALEGHLISFRMAHSRATTLGFQAEDSPAPVPFTQTRDRARLLAEWLQALPEHSETSVDEHQQMITRLHIRSYPDPDLPPDQAADNA